LPALLLTAAAPLPPPPASLRLDPFYGKYVDADGIPVIASPRAPDDALLVARELIDGLLARRPDIRRELVRQRIRVGVMAQEEATTDLPEQRHWKKPTRDDPRLTLCEKKTFEKIEAMSDRDYWNARARGLGGAFTTVGAENLLAVPGTRYFGENVLIHEFAHAILTAIGRADPRLHARIAKAYGAAHKAGRWKGDYAETSLQEYWAEGTQYWFETNMLARLDEGPIVSSADLKRYDPALYAVLGEVYAGSHRLAADRFHRHPARLNVPEGYKSGDC
jgi:hypothetical protein